MTKPSNASYPTYIRCIGYKDHKCNVLLYGRLIRLYSGRCLDCYWVNRLLSHTKVQESYWRKRYQRLKTAREAANPRICKGYGDYKCNVSLNGMDGRRIRCYSCAKEQRHLESVNRWQREKKARELQGDQSLVQDVK